MRSYTNKLGEKVIVSKAHLDTAIKIKEQLQKASNARRASMPQLVKLMEKEGFYDAEASENYRCMLKNYQKSVGKLTEGVKHADLVANKKLESIKELVGDLAYEKRQNQQFLREINKGKRELIDFATLTEEIAEALRVHNFEELQYEYEDYTTVREVRAGQKAIIACLTDLHVGALVDTDVNKFNYEVATKRMEAYMNKIIRECEENDIKDVYVVNLGDTIEHASMRFSQGFDAEFVFADQITKASDLIIKFLMGLAGKKLHVTYAGFAGNHDRITDKEKNIDGDHAVKAINKVIETAITYSNSNYLTYVQANDYNHSVGVNGRAFKFVHGDLDSYKDDTLVAKHTSLDGVDYDAVIMGHFHHFREMEVGYDKRIIMFGSLKGADKYGEKLRKISIASQGYLIVDSNGDYEVKQVKLHTI